MNRAIKTGLGLFTFIGIPVLLLSQQQNISDWVKLRNYVPSAEIANLASSTTMTSDGEKLFYVHDPRLQDKLAFRENCTIAEQSLVLGCYISGAGIFIYNVSDERLDGIKQVTAAHEMLHAAYDRLSKSEKERVDGLTSEAYNKLTNKRIRSAVADYQKRDPGIVPNELHSIMGTEVRDIGNELEEYYAQYFDNRRRVVEFSEKYEAEFTERKAKIEAYDVQLQALKMRIDELGASLNAQGDNLSQRRTELEQLRQTDADAYYNAAVAYNRDVRSYNAQLSTQKTIVTEYNQIVEARNVIASEELELINAIDSRIQEQ